MATIKIRRVEHQKRNVIEYVATMPKKIIEAMGWGDGKTHVEIMVVDKNRLELRKEGE